MMKEMDGIKDQITVEAFLVGKCKEYAEQSESHKRI